MWRTVLSLAGVALAVGATAQQTVTVFAAASLNGSFTEIGRAYQKAHGVRVRFHFAGSQQLAAQINAGAPADVFASADAANMNKVPLSDGPGRVFATNRLVIVVRKGGPSVRSLKDLAHVPKLVLAAPKVPAGKYSREVLDKAARSFGSGWKSAVLRNVVSEEQDVRSVLTKVVLGEADAGIVYATDAISVGDKVRRAEIPDLFNVTAAYLAGIPKRASSNKEARAFLDFVVSAEGRRILSAHGFGPPPRRKGA